MATTPSSAPFTPHTADSAPISLRLVHLSDIHFGQDGDGTRALYEKIRQELIADSAEMAQSLGRADRVLVAGDTAFSGRKEQYAAATEWFDQLTTAAGCSNTAVSVIPGNHDVDRGSIGPNATILINALRGGDVQSMQKHLEGLANEAADVHPLHRALRNYQDFAAQYDCGFLPAWWRPMPLGQNMGLRIRGLSSVQVSDRHDAPGKMVLGSAQYMFQRAANIEHVVLVHHPLNWFMDRIDAQTSLYTHARVLLFGHEHIPIFNKVVHDNTHELIVLHSGAATPPETGGQFVFTYNFLEVSLEHEATRFYLKVKVFPRVWSPAQMKFVADRNRMHLDGDGATEQRVYCPQFKAPALLESVPQAVPMADAVGPPAQELPDGISDMIATEDERFARLRLLFWRHLDWSQRITVLVNLGLLPSVASRPIPQVVERQALETARTQGKLGALWEAVMKYTPTHAQEKNPFAIGQE